MFFSANNTYSTNIQQTTSDLPILFEQQKKMKYPNFLFSIMFISTSTKGFLH